MKKNIFIAILLLFVSCAKEGKDGEDPFNPVYDLGLVAATTEDLNNATGLPPLNNNELPIAFNLNMPPISDQGNQGSCVAWSAGYATMSYYINKQVNGNYNLNQLGSPKFLYNQCKIGDCQSGSKYPLALEVLKNKGICIWSKMPYNDTSCSEQPNVDQFTNASNFKISGWSYVLLNNSNMIKRLLFSGYPVMISIKCYDSLFQYRGGIYDSNYGNLIGGHAVCIVGYDDSNGFYKIQNSWGSNWGEVGNFRVAYNFIQQIAFEQTAYIAIPAF